MVDDKKALPHITFVIHDVEGGVGSMNHQIIENAPFREFFRVHIILWRAQEETGRNFREPFRNADDVQQFVFSGFGNYYLTLKRFHRLLNRWPGAIVTNDGIELQALRRFGARSVLFSIVHDFYNLKLAVENLDLVDYFVCHTQTFAKSLQSNHVLRSRVQFLPHGVKVLHPDKQATAAAKKKLTIVSISRLTENKGVLLLAGIDDHLLTQGVEVDWIIIGSGELETALHQQWAGKGNARFYKPDTQEEVFRLAATGDIFVSPSSFEGYGIALLEAMSCGLVPVIHKLPVGIYADLPEDVGFSVNIGDLPAFANCIAQLARDRQLLVKMGKNANQLVTDKYDILITSREFLKHFQQQYIAQTKKQSPLRRVSSSGLLDRPYIPDAVARFVKKLRYRNKI
jgi:glycosyltransferase involved in cell wall biosynthesis